MLTTTKQHLARYGACNLLEQAQTMADLARLIFHPQGREFALTTHEPNITLLRSVAKETAPYILTDMGDLTIRGVDGDLALAGNTRAELHYDDPEPLHRLVLLHGAETTIHLGEYTTLTLTLVGDVRYQIKAHKTARVSLEEETKQTPQTLKEQCKAY